MVPVVVVRAVVVPSVVAVVVVDVGFVVVVVRGGGRSRGGGGGPGSEGEGAELLVLLVGLKVALPGLEVFDARHGSGVPHPLQRLVDGQDENVVHGGQALDELVHGVQVEARLQPFGVQVDVHGCPGV